ncbi:MAG: hypothetical protein Q9162_005538 [Coniocarpon cinnabarinum]
MTTPEYDVLLIGAGFGSICTLHRLRKLGLKCKIFEKGGRSGGIWYWNCYPGARVDSDAPIYQLFDKEIWEEFSFKERYPGWQELRRYFDFLDRKLEFTKDTAFNKTVTGATFDESRDQWLVKCADGSQTYARWFIPAIGFAAKAYKPHFPGEEKFKGAMHHTAEWPQQDVELKGKRIAVIGTGASGIQTIQESAPDAKQLTVYQRTPNFCCPMNQLPLEYDANEQLKKDGKFNEAFDTCYNTFAGFNYDFQLRKTFDDTPEERRAFFHDILITQGGFRFWLNTYSDMLFDERANLEAYNFWRDYVRSRVKDPRKKELLAPTTPPHPWGTKRPSLEQYYYECFNYNHVDILSIEDDPIAEITETGIRTASGDVRDFDVIVLATGFDAVTGSLAQLDIHGTDGSTIASHWRPQLKTALGIALHNFPNMFFLYGPQAPTAFSNGPSCVQFQAQFLEKAFAAILEKGITRFEAKEELEDEWTDRTHKVWDATLFPKAKSWYQGANIPGKKVEPLNWAGGMVPYIQALDESLQNGLQGWETGARSMSEVETKVTEGAPAAGTTTAAAA